MWCFSGAVGGSRSDDRIGSRRLQCAMLFAQFWPRLPHVMQLWPIGIERPDKELAPKGEKSGEPARPSNAAARRGGERG